MAIWIFYIQRDLNFLGLSLIVDFKYFGNFRNVTYEKSSKFFLNF